MSSAPLLATRGLTIRFGGVVAVSEVDFAVHEAELRCLIGPMARARARSRATARPAGRRAERRRAANPGPGPLCAQPKLVLLDEPTEGIQPSIIDEIAELLHTQRHKRGLAIVLVEQNLEFIRRLSDRVLIIQKGRITGQLAPDDLGDEDLVAEFLGMSR